MWNKKAAEFRSACVGPIVTGIYTSDGVGPFITL